MTSLTFCDGKGDKSFATLTKVGSHIAYVVVVDPYPIRFISGCVTDITRRQGTNFAEAPIGLSMPVSGFTEPDTLCIVSALPNAVVHNTFMGNEVNVRIKITTSLAYGSGSTA